ncbi:MAG: hypothetical protein M3457_07095 [Chloroflexota bacterium]|nr:hypothetical protein [Chloroflexota bacterium]
MVDGGGAQCPAIGPKQGDAEDWGRTIVHCSNAARPTGVAANRGHSPVLTPALREELGRARAEGPPDGGAAPDVGGGHRTSP